ncbi:EamA family transporter [Candidatus Woesearchaeota archaeon]|nr:EamA family transporter [Candidatus Woesearchaeota archaeon]
MAKVSAKVSSNNKMMPSIIGAIAVMFAAALWGVDGVVLTPRLYHLIDYISVVVFLEHAIAFGFMMLFFVFSALFLRKMFSSDLKEFRSIGKRDWLAFLWIALFGGAIGTMAITKSLLLVNFEHLSAVVILQKLQPLFAILLAMLILNERPRKEFYLWAVAALAGSYLLTFGFDKPVFSGNALFIASLYAMLAAFSFGSSTVFGKRVTNKVNFRLATYIRFGLTSIVMLVVISMLCFFTSTNKFAGFSHVGHAELMILFIIALTTGGAAIFIYYFGLKRVMASKATIYELAFPATAVLMDLLINKNMMNAGQWLGAVLVIGSMVRITRLKAGSR